MYIFAKKQTIIKCENISISSYYLYQYDSTFWGYTGVFFGFNISVIGSPPKRRGEISLQQMPKKDKKVLSALFTFQPSSLAFAFTSSTSCITAPNAKVFAVVVVDIVLLQCFVAYDVQWLFFPRFLVSWYMPLRCHHSAGLDMRRENVIL